MSTIDVEYLPLRWNGRQLEVLDQRKLPHKESYLTINSIEDCYDVIANMVVRGAPLIGFTAIWGIGIWCRNQATAQSSLDNIASTLKGARPTAVNLAYEIDRTMNLIREEQKKGKDFPEVAEKVFSFAREEMAGLHQRNKSIAESVHNFLDSHVQKQQYQVLTFCNTGALACGPMGTALGVISHLYSQGALGKAWLCETRPYLQGSRLSSFELYKEGVPHRILVEGAASYLMQRGKVDAVCIGADRIVRNGDTANKVGSSMLSILANYYNIPFFVVAPSSSFDFRMETGQEIDVEFRDENEVLELNEQSIAPQGSRAWNPSFDMTSAENITAIFCEYGVISPVTEENVVRVCGDNKC